MSLPFITLNILASTGGTTTGSEATNGPQGYEFITALVLAVLAAVVGGLVATWLKQPLLIGYLVGGMLIGPYTPGLVTNVENVQIMADIGVALLLFALGTEFSIGELKHVGKAAIGGGLLQIGLTMSLGLVVGLILGLSVPGGIFLGGLMAISSSIVMLKLLMGRGELSSAHGKLAIAVGIVQDLNLIVLVVVLPNLNGSGDVGSLLTTIGLSLLKAGLFLAGAYVFGTRFFPWILERVIRLGIREVFLLMIISIALGMAILAQALGISFALGAFVAGLIVSEAESAEVVLNEIVPIRDIFASLFFVSIGMLIDPAFVVDHWTEVGLVVVTVLFGKWLISASLFKLLGQPDSTALLAGLLLAQVGESSFVLAQIGVDSGVIDHNIDNLLLASALITIIANSLLLQGWNGFYTWARKVTSKAGKKAKAVLANETSNEPGASAHYATETTLDTFQKHVIVCGYGRVGREVVNECRQRGYPVLVVEYEPHRLEQALQEGVAGVYGDVTVEATLLNAHIERASVLAVAIPDLLVAEAATVLGRRLNPQLEILTRATEPRAVKVLKQAGATEVIQPEFEAGLEFIRRTAIAYGVGGVELAGIVNNRRAQYYG